MAAALGAELPDVGPTDRYRVDIPDYPGAEATSTTGSVLLAPPAPGTHHRIEEAPVIDSFVATEAMDALQSWSWYDAAFTGAGVKVAVFDVQWFNADLYADELGDYQTQDCQAHRSCRLPMDTLRPRYSFEEGSHGVACAQTIRDLAPGVELYLVRVNGATTLENAGRWAVEEGIDFASMSMSFFNESFNDGSGIVSATAGEMAAGGTLLVNSAGNYAEEHWDGMFADPNHDAIMDFPWGSAYLPVYLPAGTRSVVLSWDQFGHCGDTDLDAYVYDQQGVLVGRSEERQSDEADRCSPVERVGAYAAESAWYYLQVVKYAGDVNTHVAIYARDAAAYQPTPGGLADPAAATTSLAVGAVRAWGYATNPTESFSSYGPTHGGVEKPDIAGPDGLSTSIYGSVGFYGTSASTPAVAAALALVKEAHPELDSSEVAALLQGNALGGGATWEADPDRVGAGKARLWDPASTPGCAGNGAALILAPALLGRRRHRRP